MAYNIVFQLRLPLWIQWCFKAGQTLHLMLSMDGIPYPKEQCEPNCIRSFIFFFVCVQVCLSYYQQFSNLSGVVQLRVQSYNISMILILMT